MGTFDELLERVQANVQRAEEIQHALQRIEIVGRSRNGEVTATLLGSGQFTEIRIDSRIVQRYGVESVAALTIEAVNDALRKLVETSRTQFEPLLAELDASPQTPQTPQR